MTVYVGWGTCVCSACGVLKRALDALEFEVMGSCELPDTDSGNQTLQGPLKVKHMLLNSVLTL